MVGAQEMSQLESERPRVVSEARIVTPALVIMLGSTAALTGLELMKHMRTLQMADRRRVALIYIDTDDPPATLLEFRRQHSGVFQEFPLRIAVPTGVSNAPRVEQTQDEHDPGEHKGRAEEQHTFIDAKIPQYFANGAGGIRNNGHVAACFHYQLIYDALDRALLSIVRLGTAQGEARVHEVQANIVAFLGGGTGSGIIGDISVLIRDLFSYRQLKQRINLFCMLPEPIRGVSMNDLSWRKSNATACLLELIALSSAAAGTPGSMYKKFVRGKVHHLTNDPIANEVYLVGHASMGDASDTARIVGLDLFQRITDASSVGALEHSKWVDRRTLGEVDDRGLPTMFGTSCPLEVRFPAEETATAFAQISAARLLPLLASSHSVSLQITEEERQDWQRKWRTAIRFDSSSGDPLSVRIPALRRAEFDFASTRKLDDLWLKVERLRAETATNIKEVVRRRYQEELRRIDALPQLEEGNTHLFHQRIQHLKRLQHEYKAALEFLKGQNVPRIPGRPTDQERKMTRRTSLPGILSTILPDDTGEVHETYNSILKADAATTRQRLLRELLEDLEKHVEQALQALRSWLQNAEADERARTLEEQGYVSMAWKGYLEQPHPHQRHIFDLHTLRTDDRRNIAVEALYRKLTNSEDRLHPLADIDYSPFVRKYVEYVSQNTHPGEEVRLEGQIAGKLADQVCDFFRDYYMQKFQDTNLFELLEVAAPPPARGVSRVKQISEYLLEHLAHMRGLIASLVAFEAELWHEGLSTLDTSIYMGIHWRDGNQKSILDEALHSLGPLTKDGHMAMLEEALDPHRLQIVYGQHAISLSTVRDFYMDQNSAMEAYCLHQGEWQKTKGKGLMPVHSCGELQRLVTDPDALGYNHNARSNLVDRVIRKPYEHS